MKKTYEDIFEDKVGKKLSKYFDVEHQVYSIENKNATKQRKGRIDLVLRCKKTDELYGVELKNPKNHLSGKKQHDFLFQASAYTELYFKTKFRTTPAKMPIVIAPALSTIKWQAKDFGNNFDGQIKTQSNSNYYCINNNTYIYAAYNVGEIIKTDDSGNFALIFNNKKVWSSI